jgi:CRP/FNR family transcriptional regulator
MNNETSLLEQVYAPVFEDSLLREIEQKSMLITATAGQGLIKMGQPITVVPLVLSGILKVSRENEEARNCFCIMCEGVKDVP